MALKSITFENFKNRLQGHYEFGAKNFITGRNGDGKSTIKDLIAFGFCGTDSIGSKNPTHLITTGQDALKVIIETDRAKIIRTLTAKGNGSIKVEANGVATTYTQTQLEQMIGSTDVFLSALIPGYLFEIPSARRQQVLSDIMPKIDRVSLVAEISGCTLTPEEIMKYGVNRRADLVASAISVDRRGMDQAVDQKLGRVSQLLEATSPVKPAVEDVSELIKLSEENASAWAKYSSHMEKYNNILSHNDRVKKENAFQDIRRKDLAEQIAKIVLSKPVKPNDIVPELVLLPEPSFSTKALPGTDNCSTCGQAVSPRYREQIAKNNQELQDQFNDELFKVREANRLAREEYSAVYSAKQASDKAYLAAVEDNRRLEAKKKSLEIELATIANGVLKEELVELIAPAQVFSKEDHLELMEKQNKFTREMAVYESKLRDFTSAADQVAVLNKEIENINLARRRLSLLESAFKVLPEKETAQQIGRFNTETMLFDGDIVRVGGIPHRMLSTGEQLRIFWIFCREITNMMPKAHKMIFVDNYELLTHEEGPQLKFTTKEYDASQYQEFFSSCSESEFKVEVR